MKKRTSPPRRLVEVVEVVGSTHFPPVPPGTGRVLARRSRRSEDNILLRVCAEIQGVRITGGRTELKGVGEGGHWCDI